ncbi:Zinc uptake regulation protein ZUR [Methylophaga frappieri]|uniref:Zinc uptake regulation protein ZUR n=1 Tax=Methylophaga frappieri (strain ATCC BAA-2434 / DSM 25690 / JAM7) TaxID=754477 RepID=I1YG88_METFJ|nr:transcriptional repressor [Methylophaga frappieri]AFJ01931.1 Zinc uptake regulation protein ZUR [Methylophaga frappieri]
MEVDEILNRAERTCFERGAKLTPKRRKVLEIILTESRPLSAYDIVDSYQQRYFQSIPAMSVYRMLEFLISHNLAHKLTSANKFIACSSIGNEQLGQTSQFLICDKCQSVNEINIDHDLFAQLLKDIGDNNFKLIDTQLELHGLCENCQVSDL